MRARARRRGGRALALSLTAALTACALARPAAAEPPGPADALFQRATDRMSAGDETAATESLIELADRFPDHALADDALFLAAQLFEDKLSDPVRAHDTYRRLMAEYPRSRTTIAAERRLERLAGSVEGGHADALAEFMEMQRLFPARGEARSVHRAQEILAAHPDWSERARVHLWLGRVHARAGRSAAAVRHYREAEKSPNSQERFEAVLGLALAQARLGRFDAAEAALARAATEDLPPRERALEDTEGQIQRAQLREQLFVVALLAIAACGLAFVVLLRLAGGSWRGAARRLARPPTEVIYLIPVAAFLVAISLTGHQDIGPAVAIIAIGGAATTWLSGSGLPASASRGRRVAHAALSAITVVALTYVALHRNHLLDMIIATVRFGPDV